MNQIFTMYEKYLQSTPTSQRASIALNHLRKVFSNTSLKDVARKVPEYIEGRKKFFSQFLARPRIFLTDEFYDKYETQTRVNLKNELARLNHSG